MNAKAAAIVLLLVAPLAFTPAAAISQIGVFNIVDVYWGTDAAVQPSPGETATLTIIYRTESSASTKNLWTNLTLPAGFEPVGGGRYVSASFIGNIMVNANIKLQYPIFIKPTTKPGNHTAELTANYTPYTGLEKRGPTKVNLELTGKPRLQLSSPENIGEGKQTVTLTLRNDGERAAQNVKITRVTSTTATVQIGQLNLGDISSGGSANVIFQAQIPQGADGSRVPFTVEGTYLGPKNVVYSFTQTVQSLVVKESLPLSVEISVSASPLLLGKASSIDVKARNTGVTAVKQLNLSLTGDTSLRFLKPELTLGDLAPGEEKALKAEVYVSPSITATNALLTVGVQYFDESRWLTVAGSEKFNQPLIGPEAAPPVRISTSTLELKTGRAGELVLLVANTGAAPVTNLKLSYTPDAALKLLGAPHTWMSKLDPGEVKEVRLEVFIPSSNQATTSTFLIVSEYYDGGAQADRRDERKLNLPIRGLDTTPKLTVTPVTSELSIGKTNEVEIELSNPSASPVSQIRVSFTPDAVVRLFGANEIYVERLEGKALRRVKVQLYVPPTTQSATSILSASSSYFDEELWVTRSDEERLNYLLRGFIEIQLTDTAVIPTTARVGSPFSITVTVTNVGTSSATAAYAQPSLEGLPLTTFGSRSTYIGNIEINSPTTFTLNLQVSETSERQVVLPVTLRYMDNLRSIREANFKITVPVAPAVPKEATPARDNGRSLYGIQLWQIGLGGVIVVGVVVAVVLLRRRGRE